MHGIPEPAGTAGLTILLSVCRHRCLCLSQTAISQGKALVLDVCVRKGQKSESEAADVDERYATLHIDLVVVRCVLQTLHSRQAYKSSADRSSTRPRVMQIWT